MIQDPINTVTEEQIKARSMELIEEFKQHYYRCLLEGPDQAHRHILFEDWVLQKVAGLQLVVMELAERIDVMEQNR